MYSRVCRRREEEEVKKKKKKRKEKKKDMICMICKSMYVVYA